VFLGSDSIRIPSRIQRHRHRQDIFSIGFEQRSPVFAKLIVKIPRFRPGHDNCPESELD
jgi:hypothetical protein